jgi:SAM-dependent methyltransferase
MDRSVEAFNRDAEEHGGYLYTDITRLSSRLATQRTTDVILGTGHIEGRAVLDLACGDGFYAVRFWDQGRPRMMVGIDAAEQAVVHARRRAKHTKIRFAVCDAHRTPFEDGHFDLVLLQSVLHHDGDPRALIREAFRLAPTVLIHEPNGNNPGLKLIERTSRYHIDHDEKSFRSAQLKQWVTDAGGRVIYQKFAGFVPMFCPPWVARITKLIEPVLEAVPVINAITCAVCVLVAIRNE